MQICTTLGFGFGLRPSPLNMGEHLKCDYDQILPADIDNAKLFAFFFYQSLCIVVASKFNDFIM